ncbi:hypothetical protein B0H14DRAFT_2611244 [Mycena olivaceomarginata]|nr:hypothetical protein B0H14DRAFT_2611244 [Mycena olivaceomarginata]
MAITRLLNFLDRPRPVLQQREVRAATRLDGGRESRGEPRKVRNDRELEETADLNWKMIEDSGQGRTEDEACEEQGGNALTCLKSMSQTRWVAGGGGGEEEVVRLDGGVVDHNRRRGEVDGGRLKSGAQELHASATCFN